MPSATLPGCCCIIAELQGGRSAPIITMFFAHGRRVSARRYLGYLLSQRSPFTLPAPLASLRRRFTPPHCTHRRTRRLDTEHLHTPKRVGDADHLRTLSSGVDDAVDRHNCGLVVGPSSDGRCHRGLGGGIPLQDSDRAEVSCRSLCKQRRPGPQTWFAGLSTVAPAPTFPSPHACKRPELARPHESRKKFSLATEGTAAMASNGC